MELFYEIFNPSHFYKNFSIGKFSKRTSKAWKLNMTNEFKKGKTAKDKEKQG